VHIHQILLSLFCLLFSDNCLDWPRSNNTFDPSAFSHATVITAASTGIAGILLIGGGTVHSKFHVPNTVDSKTTPQVAWESTEAIRLRGAELIVIDVNDIFVFFSNNLLGSQHA
jgi:hypothetical protein